MLCAVGSSIFPRSRRFCQNMPEMCNIFFYVASYFSRLNDKFLELYWWRIIQLCTFPFTCECLAKRVHSDSKIDNLDDPNTRGSVIFQNCLHVSLQFAYRHKSATVVLPFGTRLVTSKFVHRFQLGWSEYTGGQFRVAGNQTNQTLFTSGFK